MRVRLAHPSPNPSKAWVASTAISDVMTADALFATRAPPNDTTTLAKKKARGAAPRGAAHEGAPPRGDLELVFQIGSLPDVVLKVQRGSFRSVQQLKQRAADEAAAISGAKMASSAVKLQSLQDPDGTGALKLLPVNSFELLQSAEAVQVTLKRSDRV